MTPEKTDNDTWADAVKELAHLLDYRTGGSGEEIYGE